MEKKARYSDQHMLQVKLDYCKLDSSQRRQVNNLLLFLGQHDKLEIEVSNKIHSDVNLDN